MFCHYPAAGKRQTLTPKYNTTSITAMQGFFYDFFAGEPLISLLKRQKLSAFLRAEKLPRFGVEGRAQDAAVGGRDAARFGYMI